MNQTGDSRSISVEVVDGTTPAISDVDRTTAPRFGSPWTESSFQFSEGERKPSVITQPSEYQRAIFDWSQSAKSGNNLSVNAVAGSGKTVTQVSVIRRLRGRRIVLSFNRSVKEEMERRLSGSQIKVQTLNGCGHGALCRAGMSVRVNGDITKLRIYDEAGKRGLLSNSQNKKQLADNHYTVFLASRVASACKNMLLWPEDIEVVRRIMDHFLYEYTEQNLELIHSIVSVVLTEMRDEAREKQVKRGELIVDFDDQLWLPHILELSLPRYDWVGVDEAQDMNQAQIEMVLKLGKTGSVMAYGDKRQAIYGFRGANVEAIDYLVESLDAVEYPLSITYRCPRRVVALAQQIVPEIEASPDAEEGEIWDLENVGACLHALEQMTDQDLVLCRTNAPLLTAAKWLMSRGKPVRLVGRDYATQLCRIIDNITGHTNMPCSSFDLALHLYRERELTKKDSRRRSVTELNDRVDVLRIASVGMQTSEDVKKLLNTMFNSNHGLPLSSVHRAKGMEARRVAILRPDLMPHPSARTPWEILQEENLRYVAWTRAKQTLLFCHDFGISES